jgi:hypothetical protein
MKRSIFACLLLVGGASAAAWAQGDPATLDRIVSEGKDRSQVWATLEHLSHGIGVRLTGSSRCLEANAWARDRFAAYGLKNARLEKWGEIPVGFDRGPCSARVVAPVERVLEFTARSWSAGTGGPVRGRVVRAPATMEDLEAARPALAGAWVLSKSPPRRRGRRTEEAGAADLTEALWGAGIAGRIVAASNELVHTGAERGWREMSWDNLPQRVSITVRRSDYDAINSRLADGEEVEVEVDLVHHFVRGPIPVYNTIAEIPGTEFPDQAVILSGHLDSWDGPGSEAAQDNGTGSAVTLEAARILMAAGVKPRRTIRFILWTGEEQGLLGSSAYAEALSEAQRNGISAVFVEDGGTNYEGGLVCIDAMAPMLRAATAAVGAAFPDMPVAIDVRERMPRGGGSDHVPFNRLSIPGFFWTETGIGGREGKDYDFIHHTQNDITRYAIPEYVVQSAVCSAVTIYNLAMADTLLPREQQEAAPSAEPAPAPPAEVTWVAVTGPLSGTWEANVPGGEEGEDRRFTLSFEMAEDGRVRGTIDSRIGGGALKDVAFETGTGSLSFAFDSEFGPLKFQATLREGGLEGTIAGEGGMSMRFTAARKPAEIAAGAQ